MSESPSSQSGSLPPRQNGVGAWIAILFSILILAVLIFAVPYSAGYQSERLPLSRMLVLFWGYEQWQHCWLILPAVIFIVYSQRKELAQVPVQGSNWGLLPFILALAAYWVGYRVENYYIGFLSIQLLVGGMIVWFGGWRWLLSLLFVYGFLMFIWPFYFLENSITFPLRMLMSKTSVFALNAIGIPVIQSGTGILSAPESMLGLQAGQKFSVDVADPCSGIRSLFALMMVSALYAHFMLQGWVKKWLLFLCSIPLAIAGNLCRILMLTFGIIAMGSEKAIGTLEHPSFFHMLAGYLVFAVALAGMALIAFLLSGGLGRFSFRSSTQDRPPRNPSVPVKDVY